MHFITRYTQINSLLFAMLLFAVLLHYSLNWFANFRTIQFSELIEFFCILNDREKNLIIEFYFEKIQKVKNSILLQI